MPLAFPSHQGLIAPLWRRFPAHFNVLALYVGAAMPDAVDLLLAPFRGELGQWYGHTLLGSVVFCIPLGLLVTGLCLFLARSTVGKGWGRWIGESVLSSYTDPQDISAFRRWWFLSRSVWLGAFSHVMIDLVTHRNFILLYPWYQSDHFFPAWWSREWFTIQFPFYPLPYSAGPHLAAWVVLSLLGLLLFLHSSGPSKGKPVVK